MKNEQNPSKTKKKLPVWALILIILGALIIVVAAVMLLLVYGLLGRVTRPEAVNTATPAIIETAAPTETPAPEAELTAEPEISSAPTPTPELTPLPLSEIYTQTRLTSDVLDTMDAQNRVNSQFINVLLVGADRRGTSGSANADVMMIATVDKEHGALKLTSIMRDMLVNIPGYGYNKLNSAPAKGGYELLMQTINENFHLNITEYVMVDFNMFEDIVDKVGGVTVRMTAEEISAANDCIAGLNKERGVEYLWDGFIFADAGNVKLTGKQALGFARVRHIDSDFSRTQRQFKILNAIYAKFRSMSITKQYQLLYDLLPMVETNMTNDSILTAGVFALSMNASGLTSFRIPVDGLYESGRYDRKQVLLVDVPANAWELHKFIYESEEAAVEATMLTPGESLPPRTPTPEWMLPDLTTPTPDLWGN